MFELKVPGCGAGDFFRKYIRTIGNIHFDILEVRCDSSHAHVHAIGTTKYQGKMQKRSGLSRRYPARLCAAVEAAAFALILEGYALQELACYTSLS